MSIVTLRIPVFITALLSATANRKVTALINLSQSGKFKHSQMWMPHYLKGKSCSWEFGEKSTCTGKIKIKSSGKVGEI